MKEYHFQYQKHGGVESIASTNSGNLAVPFIHRPPQERRSEVAIVKSPSYVHVDDAIREAIGLLGGIERFGRKGEIVVIKPNVCAAEPPEMADTTNPAVVAAVVRMFKDAGTTVIVMDRAGFNQRAETAYEVTGIKEAALKAGADQLWDWQKEEYVEVEVPNPRSFAKVKLPKALMEANAFIDLPKLKNNYMIGPGALTLSVKSRLGLIPCEDRDIIHRQPIDMAAGCCDIAKAMHHLHRLTLIDGVYGIEGSVHHGTICRPGIIVASPDMVAAEAVCHAVVGYHPMESPCVQIAMKDGLGTAELSEIDILGTRIQDVYYPFVRCHLRYVQKYVNVKEYFGGTCLGCLIAMQGLPPVVNDQKRYAVIGGTRVLLATSLGDFDEVYLVGECACREDHQFRGFMDKVNAAKKVIKIGTCPGLEGIEKRKWGGVYDAFMLLAVDTASNSTLPETVNSIALKSAYERREGKVNKL